MYKLFLKKFIACMTLVSFMFTSVPASFAQSLSVVGLMPKPGVMVQTSAAFVPAILKGMKVYPKDPLRFDFVIDTGNTNLSQDDLQKESSKLVRYFLASLTVPETDLWVNLSPYEGDRIIPENFGLTEMGRDLLAEDYILKQLTSSLMYPEKAMGAALWKRIYALAADKYGTTDIPLDTFNKVWIMPDAATVYVNGNTALIASSHLKVMLDTDYLAMKNAGGPEVQGAQAEARAIPQQVIREVVLPELEKEINGGENFSTLRQIYHAMILSTWFKRNLKRSLVGQVYTDQNKVVGIDLAEKEIKDKIWKQYVEAFKKGAFNYIKEEMDETTQEVLPRKYFAGGFHHDPAMVTEERVAGAMISDAAEAGRVGNIVVAAANFDPVEGKDASQLPSDHPFIVLRVKGVLAAVLKDRAFDDVKKVDEILKDFENLDELKDLMQLIRDQELVIEIRKEISKAVGAKDMLLFDLKELIQSKLFEVLGIDVEKIFDELAVKFLIVQKDSVRHMIMQLILAEILLYFLPDEWPVYRSVPEQFAGFPGELTNKSFWAVGESGRGIADKYEESNFSSGLVMVSSTVGKLRKNGSLIEDSANAYGAALVLLHHDRSVSLEVKIEKRYAPKAGSDALLEEDSMGIKEPVSNAHLISPIAQLNVDKIFSNEFKNVLDQESIGGNAGPGYAAVNGVMDVEGKVVAFGNSQYLRIDMPDYDRRLEEGSLIEFSVRTKVIDLDKEDPHFELFLQGRDIKQFSSRPKIPQVAIDRMEESLKEADRISKDRVKAKVQVQAFVKAVQAGKYQRKATVDLRNSGKEVILVGDLHAQLVNLKKILNDNKNLEKIQKGEMVLVILGDAVHSEINLSEMDTSVEIMQFIMDLKIKNPDNVYYVLGNHDYLSGTFKKGNISQGLVSQGLVYRAKLIDLYGEEYVNAYQDFINASPLWVRGDGFVGLHAGPVKGATEQDMLNAVVSDEGNKIVHQALWNRYKIDYNQRHVDAFLSEMGQRDDVLIVGHSPQGAGEYHWRLMDNHHVIFAGDERAVGYARINNGKVDFITATSASGELIQVKGNVIQPQVMPHVAGILKTEKINSGGRKTVSSAREYWVQAGSFYYKIFMEGSVYKFQQYSRDKKEPIGGVSFIEESSPYLVGRINGNYVLGSDSFLSRSHFKVQVSGAQKDGTFKLELEDVGSSNKTTLEWVDAAMDNVGGIDMNSKQLRLQEKGGRIDFNGEIDPSILAKQIDGFSPVILSVTPLSSPKEFFSVMVS